MAIIKKIHWNMCRRQVTSHKTAGKLKFDEKRNQFAGWMEMFGGFFFLFYFYWFIDDDKTAYFLRHKIKSTRFFLSKFAVRALPFHIATCTSINFVWNCLKHTHIPVCQTESWKVCVSIRFHGNIHAQKFLIEFAAEHRSGRKTTKTNLLIE